MTVPINQFRLPPFIKPKMMTPTRKKNAKKRKSIQPKSVKLILDMCRVSLHYIKNIQIIRLTHDVKRKTRYCVCVCAIKPVYLLRYQKNFTNGQARSSHCCTDLLISATLRFKYRVSYATHALPVLFLSNFFKLIS